MTVQKKSRLNDAELFLILFYIQSKEIQDKKFCKENRENLKNGKVRFCPNIDVRKEKEDSWLNAMKTTTKFVCTYKMNDSPSRFIVSKF